MLTHRYIKKKFNHETELIIGRLTTIGEMMDAAKVEHDLKTVKKNLKKIRSLVVAHQAEL
jgi:hypothetical protein